MDPSRLWLAMDVSFDRISRPTLVTPVGAAVHCSFQQGKTRAPRSIWKSFAEASAQPQYVGDVCGIFLLELLLVFAD